VSRALPIALLFVGAPACAGDAVVDLSIQAWDAREIASAEVVVCSARDRSEVLERASLDASSAATVSLPADGSAVAFAATSSDGLCGATCQVELDPDASIRTPLVLHPCVACPTLAASAENVCRDPLCFMTEPELSGCD